MSNKELNAAIKNELKKAGYNTRDFRVSVKDCGYSTSAHVTIKSPKISITEIRNILNCFEEIDRDERTGEILEGANLYLFIEYEDGIFDIVSQDWAATARSAYESKDETTTIFDGLYLINLDHAGDLEIRQQNGANHCTRKVYDFKHLCEFIYKFSTFGNIEA